MEGKLIGKLFNTVDFVENVPVQEKEAELERMKCTASVITTEFVITEFKKCKKKALDLKSHIMAKREAR